MAKDLFINRSIEGIEELMQVAKEVQQDGKSRYSSLTYEDGIMETLRWLFEDGDHPYMGGKWDK